MCYSDNSIAFRDEEVLSHAGQKGDERPTVKKPPEKFGWSTRDPTKRDPTKLAGPPPKRSSWVNKDSTSTIKLVL